MFDPKEVSSQVAGMLLDINAVQFRLDDPFTWSSGWRSPIYCDGRLSLSHPSIRSYIRDSFVQLTQAHFPHVEVIAGVATAGVPQGALVADKLDLPFIYVRSKPKGHGKENLIEGDISPGQKVILIEDVISTGRSALQAAQALRTAGMQVEGVLAILTYGFDQSQSSFAEQEVALHTLSDYTAMLIEVDKRVGLDEKTMASLHEWRKSPDTWQPRHG